MENFPVEQEYTDMIILDSIEEDDVCIHPVNETSQYEECENMNTNNKKDLDKAQLDTVKTDFSEKSLVIEDKKSSSVSLRQPTQYRNVCIVGNPNYHPYLQQLSKRDKVILHLNSCSTTDAVRKNFSSLIANELDNTLWLLAMGMEFLGTLKYWYLCRKDLCSSPIIHFQLKDSLMREEINSWVKSLIGRIKSLQTEFGNMVGVRSNVIVMPFAPVIGDTGRNHDILHKSEFPAFFMDQQNLCRLQQVLIFFNENYCFQLNLEKNMEDMISSVKHANDLPALHTYIKKMDSFIEYSLTNVSSITSHVTAPILHNSSTGLADLQLGRFKHVLIVGNSDLPRLCRLPESVHVSYIACDFPITWVPLEKALENMQHDKKHILVVCVYDISAVCIPTVVTGTNFYYYRHGKKAVRKNVSSLNSKELDNNTLWHSIPNSEYFHIQGLINSSTNYFSTQANFLIMPLVPRLVINWPSAKQSQQSIMANDSFNIEHCPIYIDRSQHKAAFKKMANYRDSFLANMAYKYSDITLDELNLIFPIGYYEDVSLQSENLIVWRNYLVKSIQVYGEGKQQHISHMTKLNDGNSASSEITFTDSQQTSDIHSEKRRAFVWTPPPVKKSKIAPVRYPNIMQKFGDLHGKRKYEHVYIIGSNRSINQLKSTNISEHINIPVTFVCFKYTGSIIKQVSEIQDRLMPIREKSVCLLLFDIDYFFNMKYGNAFCMVNDCNSFLSFMHMQDKSLDDGQLATEFTLTQTRIQLATTLLSNLGLVVPCFPVPLSPHVLYCAFDYMGCHNMMHWLSEQNSLVVGGEKLWNLHRNNIVNEWSKLMLNHYQKSNLIVNINKFLDSFRKTLYQTINDPLSISDQKDCWVLQKDIIVQLLTWIQIPQDLSKIGIDCVEYIDGNGYCTICPPNEVMRHIDCHLESKKHLLILNSKKDKVKEKPPIPIMLARPTSRYKKVFVVGNPNYHPYLQHLAAKNKVILKLSSLTLRDIRKQFSDLNTSKLENTLWLLFFGIDCLGTLIYWNLCESELCNSPLYQFRLHDSMKMIGLEATITSTMNQLNLLQKQLQLMVGRGSSVIIMPFAPVIGDIRRTHRTLHSGEIPSIYMDKASLNHLRKMLASCRKIHSAQFHLEKNECMEELNSTVQYACDIQTLKTYIGKIDSFIEHSLTDLPSIVSPVIAPPSLQLGRFRHILLVGGFMLAELCAFDESEHVSYFNSGFPIIWGKLRKALNKVQHDKKHILVVFAYDISAFYIRKKVKKTNFHYYDPHYITNGCDSIQNLITNCTNYFGSKGNLLITPLVPRLVFDWPATKQDQRTLITKEYLNIEHCPLYISFPFKDLELSRIKSFLVHFHTQFAFKFVHGSLAELNKQFPIRNYTEDMNITLQSVKLQVWRNYLMKSIKVYGEKDQNISHTAHVRDCGSPNYLNSFQTPQNHSTKRKHEENKSRMEPRKYMKTSYTPPALLDLEVDTDLIPCPYALQNICKLKTKVSQAEVDKEIIQSCSEICELKVWNLSKFITHRFISDIAYKLSPEFRFESNLDGSFSAFLPLRKAKLVEQKLNNLRIANIKLRSECIQYKDYKIKFKHLELQQIETIFGKVLANWKDVISRELMSASVTPVINLTTFKTGLCDGRCSDQNLCHLGHGSWDTRRNPFSILYSNTMCPTIRNGLCPHGISCKYSHNAYEYQYHPSTFQTKACNVQIAGRANCSRIFCEFYHTNTSEMIFTREWENQIIFGLDKTVQYFAAAVRSLRKLPTSGTESAEILVLSPSLSFLEILQDSHSSVLDSYRNNCLILKKNFIEKKRNWNILMGTPFMFNKMLHKIKKNISKVSLIIIDDFGSMLEDRSMAQQVFVFFKHLRNFGNFSGVSLVVTVDTFDKQMPYLASRFFNTAFNVVTPKGVTTEDFVSSKVGIKRRLLKANQNTASEHLLSDTQTAVGFANLHCEDKNVPNNAIIHNERSTRKDSSQYTAPSSHYPPSVSSVRQSSFGLASYLPSPTTTRHQAGDWQEPSIQSTGETSGMRSSSPKETDRNRIRKYESGPSHPVNKMDVHSALVLLNEFSKTVKYLGPNMDEVVSKAMQLYPESKMLDYLSTDCNIAIIQESLHTIIVTKVSKAMSPLYEKLFTYCMNLLEILSSHTKPIATLPDVGKIAKATIGKDSLSIVGVIKKSLADIGQFKPSKELINEIFISICSIHFNMTIDKT